MELKGMGIDKFTDYIDELIKYGVDEIIENKKDVYTFLVGNYWYNVECEGCGYGYRFRVVLRRGINICCIDEKVYVSSDYSNSERKNCKRLFDIIEMQYVKHKIFDNGKIVRYFKNYIQLIERCTQILKLTENIFIVHIDNVKYSFERSEKYNSKSFTVQTSLLINRYTNEKVEQIYDKSNCGKNDAIFAVLNAVYHLNQTERDLEIRDDINTLLNLNK